VYNAGKQAQAELVAQDYNEEDDYGSGIEDGEVPGYMDSDEEEPIEQMRLRKWSNQDKQDYSLSNWIR